MSSPKPAPEAGAPGKAAPGNTPGNTPGKAAPAVEAAPGAAPSKPVKPAPGNPRGEIAAVVHHLLRSPSALIGLAVIGMFTAAAAAAPLLTRWDPAAVDFEKYLLAPSGEHLLGTDELGRDLFARLLYGARISLSIGLISVSIGLMIGVPLGAFSGWYGGALDLILQRLIDILIAFPGILLAIVVVAILGVGVENVMIAIGIASIPKYARLVRGGFLSLKRNAYTAAARAAGLGDLRIIFGHILPNCLGPIIVQSTFQMATAILWAAGLGFLGLGAQPPTPEWGAILSRGRAYIRGAHHLTTFPGIAIFLMVLGFNLVGDGLRDVIDPKSRSL